MVLHQADARFVAIPHGRNLGRGGMLSLLGDVGAYKNRFGLKNETPGPRTR